MRAEIVAGTVFPDYEFPIARPNIQKDLELAEYTDPERNQMIPPRIALKPGLLIRIANRGRFVSGLEKVEKLSSREEMSNDGTEKNRR